MPAIKTREWLLDALSRHKMTQKELAEKSGLSLPAISKICIGERLGSPESWNKILTVFNTSNVSVESSNMIEELKEEIEEYGPTYGCMVFYEINEIGSIIFKDYALPEDMKNSDFNKGGLGKLNSLRITLKEALELFENQDRIF